MLADSKKNIKRGTFTTVLFHIGGLLVIAVMVFLVIANIKIYKTKQEFEAEATQLKNQIEDMKKRNNDLSHGIENSDDDDYIEKVAREELDLQKPGEKTISFIMPESHSQEAQNQKAEDGRSWWQKFWDILFK